MGRCTTYHIYRWRCIVCNGKFQETLFAAFDKFFPKQVKKANCKLMPRQDWMTKGLVTSCLTKAKLYQKYRQSDKLLDKINYQNFDHQLKKLVRAAEKNYYTEKFKQFSGNSRKTWGLLNTIINKPARVEDSLSLMINGVMSHDMSVIVEKFNDFFVNIGAVLTKSIQNTHTSFDSFLGGNYPNSFALDPTTPDEIIKIAS